MDFSRQEYWSGLPFPSPGDFPNPGIEPGFPALQADALPSETRDQPMSPALEGRFSTTVPPGKSQHMILNCIHLKPSLSGYKVTCLHHLLLFFFFFFSFTTTLLLHLPNGLVLLLLLCEVQFLFTCCPEEIEEENNGRGRVVVLILF